MITLPKYAFKTISPDYKGDVIWTCRICYSKFTEKDEKHDSHCWIPKTQKDLRDLGILRRALNRSKVTADSMTAATITLCLENLQRRKECNDEDFSPAVYATYFRVRCPRCKWEGMSNQAAGGGAIADTGDYDDIICPFCINGFPSQEEDSVRVTLEELE